MSSPQPSQLPTSQEIEAVILAATNNLTITGQPLKDTRTQVFVGNLPYRVRWQDLKDLFRSPPPTPSSEFHPHLPHPQESRVTNTVLRADVSLGPDNRSRGYGTVLLATKEDADRCINLLDGYCWMGRVLEVRVDRLVASPSAAMFPGGVSGVGVGTTPPPPPLQQQQQQMQGMGKTLYLTNIPPQTQWTSLKDLLRALQITVIRVDLSLSSSLPSSSSSSTSWAKVIVASSNDVRRAIGGLDGIEYMGYVLRVRTEEELVQLQTSLLQQEQNVSEAAMVPIPPSQSQSSIPSIGGSGRRSVPPPPLPLSSLAPGSGSPPREKEKDRDTSSNTSSGSAETTRSTSSRHHLPPHLHHHHHQPHPHPQHPGPISLPLSVLTHPHPHPHHPYSPLHHPSQTQLGLPPLTPSMPSFQFSGTTSGTPLQPHFLSPGIGIGGGNGTPGGGNGGGWGRTPGGWGMMMLGGMGSPPIMQQQQSPMHHHQPQPGDYFQPPMQGMPSPYQQPPPPQQQQPEYFPPVPPPPPPPNSLLTSPDPSLTSFDPSSSISGSSPSSISGLTTDDGISQNTSSIATSLSSSASSSFSSPGEGSQVEGGKSTMTRTTSDPLTSTSSSAAEPTAPGLPSPPSSPRHPPPPLKKKDHPRFKESEFANIISGGAFAALNLGGGNGTTPLGQRRNSWTPGTERGPVF